MRASLNSLWMIGFVAIALLAVDVAHATDLRVTCTPATSYEDKTPIPSSATSTFSLYGGLAGQAKAKLVANSASCLFNRANVAVGTQEYYVTQTTNGVESAPSITVSYTVAPPVPGAPSGVTVTVQITVATP